MHPSPGIKTVPLKINSVHSTQCYLRTRRVVLIHQSLWADWIYAIRISGVSEQQYWLRATVHALGLMMSTPALSLVFCCSKFVLQMNLFYSLGRYQITQSRGFTAIPVPRIPPQNFTYITPEREHYYATAISGSGNGDNYFIFLEDWQSFTF
jgi:hypothetical protein